MQPQRRVNNNLSDMEERKEHDREKKERDKEQARKKREREAARQAASKYPEDLKDAQFDLQYQPQQQVDGDGTVLHYIIRKALGDHNLFRKVLRQGKQSEQLLLGLDNTVPGTPEVNDSDFDNPLNGHLNNILGKSGKKQSVQKGKGNDFAEPKPKGKVEPKPDPEPAAKAKPLPKPLDMQKPTSKEPLKNPNIDIGDILKKMTSVPDTLTDIETPGKVPSSKTFHFPQTAPQMTQSNKSEVKTKTSSGTAPSKGDNKNSSIKVESRKNDADTRNTFKKVGPDKKRSPSVKSNSSVKSKQGRKVSTSSSSSGDDSSSEDSGSSDSESEKANRSALNSPSVQPAAQTSEMHKTEFGCNNYILNKENKLHPGGLGYNFSSDNALKQVPISEISDFPYVQTNKKHDTDDSVLMDKHPSLSPMNIDTISPLDPSSLFENLDFPNFHGTDELMPSLSTKPDDFSKVSTENASKSRLKTNTNEDYREPSLDDSLDDSSTNLILNKHKKGTGVLYQKDSKTNSKLYKSNETKHINKSKSTRIDSGPKVPTKGAMKYIPEQRRKSVSDSSDKEDNSSKVRKTKDTSANKKNVSEKSTKREKTPKNDRLKSKTSVMKETITIDKSDDNDSADEKKPILDVSCSPPPQTSNDTTTTTSDAMPVLIKSTSSVTTVEDPIPRLTDSVCPIPNDFIPYPVDDKCFFDSMSSTFVGTTLSPMNSPECLINKYEEPPTLVKEVKGEESLRSSYEVSVADTYTVELKSPGHDFDLTGSETSSELVNVSLSEPRITSQDTSLVSDIFTQSRMTDMSNYSLTEFFPSSLGLDDGKPEPLLLPELTTQPSLLDPLQEIKPNDKSELQEELWVNDDPYSVNDIENIVPKIPAHHHLPSSVDVLNTNIKCLDPVLNFDEITPPSKLTIKIPLNGIKLKSKKYRDQTNLTNSSCNSMESSLSPSHSDSFEIDVENDLSPVKRKRKKHQTDKTCAAVVPSINADRDHSVVNKSLEFELETSNNTDDVDKLVIRINLAKLKRAPLFGANSSDQSSKGKARPPKISKLNPEFSSQDVASTDVSSHASEAAIVKEHSPLPPRSFMPDLPPTTSTPPPSLFQEEEEEMKTEDCHKNDVSHTTELLSSSSDKETKKKRGRPPKSEKVEKKSDSVKKQPCKLDSSYTTNCDTSDDEVCRECGTLRKDYGRWMDNSRINSYKSTYSGYYVEARSCKHRADNLKTPIERAHKYTEAVLKYVQYLIGLELSGKMNIMQGVEEYMQITSECIQLVDYVVTHYGRKENPNNTSYDVRFTLLCLRLQSILYLKLFKVKKESAMKYSKALSRYFKNFKNAGHTGPTLYPKPVHNRGSTGTPSPSSPSPGPSPGGSVASIGSAGSSSGSTGGNDVTPNGLGQYVTIPTDVHEKAFQHLQYSKNLLHCHNLWEDSESLTRHCQPFLTKLSRKAGSLTMQSSMLHVVDYVTSGLEIIKESPLAS